MHNTLCPHCGDMFVYEGRPEIAMGACACPSCGGPVTQADVTETRASSMVRRVLGESADKTVPKPVVVRQRQVEYDECPHCGVEIYEKHIYEDDSGITHHSDCGGAIIPKPFDWSTIDPKWRALLAQK